MAVTAGVDVATGTTAVGGVRVAVGRTLTGVLVGEAVGEGATEAAAVGDGVGAAFRVKHPVSIRTPATRLAIANIRMIAAMLRDPPALAGPRCSQ